MAVEVIWGPVDGERDADVVRLDRAVGFDAEILNSVDARSSVVAGGYGKGASGSGVGLAFQVAEHVLGDTASLVGLGLAVRALVARVSERRGSRPNGATADALAAVAAASEQAIAGDPARWHYARTVPLTTDGSAGTDMRDVWASAFEDQDRGIVQVVFLSSTTRYLGTAVVPVEFHMGAGQLRTDEQLRESFGAWF